MLEIRGLRITIGGRQLVGIDELDVREGERVGIVGESGSGKSLTVMSVPGLLPLDISAQGSIQLMGQELLGMADNRLRRIRGRDIGVVFQDPMRSLNPTMKVGRQVGEALKIHRAMRRREVHEAVLELFTDVQLPNPVAMASRYPHELSGGQQQRVMIAMAVACKPRLLIADEPTTALDVTVQQGVLELMMRLARDSGVALLFVSHNLGVVQAITDRVVVMQGGRIVETGVTRDVIQRPQEDYTKALIDANPSFLGAEA